jgi:acyl-CoA thioesterase II
VDARTFLGLEPTGDPLRWRMPVDDHVSTGGGFLFGGCGLAAAVAALEGSTGRPLVWATAQYLSYARPPSVLDVDVTLAVQGNSITQGRAVARVDGDEILTVNAALGSRATDQEGEWAVRPEVPPPDECGPREHRHAQERSIMSHLEVRMAAGRPMADLDGTPGDGRSAMWARLPDGVEVSAASLAIVGDFVPSGISQALGIMGGGNSLDNTLRMVRVVPSEWLLLDIRVHAVAHGFAHGLVHIWAEDGTLLATASQSTIVRYWRD